jgi:hypothetical protein
MTDPEPVKEVETIETMTDPEPVKEVETVETMTDPEPVKVDIVTAKATRRPFIDWVHDVAGVIADTLISEALKEMQDEPEATLWTKWNISKEQEPEPQEPTQDNEEDMKISCTPFLTVFTSFPTVDTIKANSAKEQADEPQEPTQDSEEEYIPCYDADIVECCKTWTDGGFVKALKVIKPEEYKLFSDIIGNTAYYKNITYDIPFPAEDNEYLYYYITIHSPKNKPTYVSLPIHKYKYRDVFETMCASWSLFKKSKEYDEHTHGDLFDDTANYDDAVIGGCLSIDNIMQLMVDTEPQEPQEPQEPTQDSEEEYIPCYDADIVECCKTWTDGGFVQAFRMMQSNPEKYDDRITHRYKCDLVQVTEPTIRKKKKTDEADAPMYKKTYKKIYRNGETVDISFGQLKEELEDVFNCMCDAWFDFKRSDDYNDNIHDDIFDDEVEYSDVMGECVNADNIKEFMN